MAALNGLANGINGHGHANGAIESKRFSDIPGVIDVTVAEGDVVEQVEIDLVELADDPTELCILLENESVVKSTWMTIALAYAKQHKFALAIDILHKARDAFSRAGAEEKLSILSALFWLNLCMCREAPRLRPDGASPDLRTKEQWIQAATANLNDASRISPSYAPLFLARGVLYLLRASAITQTKAGAPDSAERTDALRQAAKCFDDSNRAYGGKNLMATLGKARVQYSLGKYADALQCYQQVLERAPDMVDPDPRIGIGCCLWQLGHKDDAKNAWQRALELCPDSKTANILLGLYHLNVSSQYPTSDPAFAPIYKKAMTQYTQKAFKLDDKYPLTCATFGGYFLMRKAMAQVERLSRRAIDFTDVNAVAGDGWYLLGRKEHYENEISKALEYYQRADTARGGEDRGYLPAKFGIAQIRIMMQDFEGAKLRLEKIIQQSKSIEAMTLLGTLYAEDVFTAQTSNLKEDKSNELKKAISLLEGVRSSWKDPKRKVSPDSAVLLNLARLYETDHPEKSLQCLHQVEQMEIDEIPEEDRPEEPQAPDSKQENYEAAREVHEEAKRAYVNTLRENLPPQLLNNMGCFYYQQEKYAQARELFQSALNACVKVGDKDQSVDTDALVTTISYSLARTYEAEGMLDEAKKVYEGLLQRHSDYVDANIRLTYIKLRQSPQDEGPKAMSELYKAESSNLEVRALYGWYLSKAKKRTNNINEDQEQRHYKHTLQQYDKHDRYSLTGMGDIYLAIAREMRRDTEQDKEKRRKMYQRAVEFFDKALQLDPKNAYAAQGIGIALIECNKDFAGAVQLFTKVRETMKDPSVYINLGHVYCELKQYSRAIENYEAALAKDRARDATILACLGRVWLLRGKQEKSVQAMKTSLDYSQRALEVAPEQIHFKFNVAFVQIQIAQLIYQLPENARSLEEVEAAAKGLDDAIEAFIAIAKSPNPPFPRNDIEQRANMGKNTMRKQLDRAIQSQREYEEKNAAKLKEAREKREAEIRKREEEKRQKEEAEAERLRQIAEERQKMQERDRELAAKRAEEDKRRDEAEMTTDSETGERKKRAKRKAGGGGKRKKKGDGSDSEGEAGSDSEGGRRGRRSRRRTTTSATPGVSGDEKPRKAKKRKLERKTKQSSKFKSSEFVQSDDDSDLEDPAQAANESLAAKVNDAEGMESGEDDAPVTGRHRKRVVDDDEDEDEDGGAAPANGDVDGDTPMAGLDDDEE
ncbi:Tetratricopeptide TPR-1 [Neofusicoccum parvum]|uniref:Putative rna polymerase ii transcription elongation factor protein n=1 Tax=Botryosphaeria parva (strain UCR-NP2) TaxID=1287680 RepID=R1G869_BOTPV|nr:putative rna polymerase ii transcription elongation factor protein [Neofusicoccum parvum UCRNP2]GME53682.1 Tetratricopeptide TPR-1 [Neofusicoccum parvum]